MKDPITTPGRTYAVTSPNGCTVTTEDGLTLAEVEAGSQGYFVAVGSKVLLSDEAAVLTQVFKLAPYQKLRLLGVVGGNGGLPAGYKRVEYIQTQKFTGLATDFLPSNETEVYVDVIRVNDTYYGRLCGNLGGGGSYRMFAIHHMNGTVSFDFGNYRTDVKTSSESDSGKRYTAKYGQSGVFINGELVGDVPVRPQFKAITPMYIFTVPQSEAAASGEYRCFRFIVRDAGEIVFDFIPALDEVGAPCFWESKSKVPYYNIGTLDFLYPTESTTYSLRRVLPDWGQLTPHGLRRLYHAPASYKGELYDYALENGFKPIIEPEKPEAGYWAPRWTETEDEIVLEWVEAEPPMDEPLTETE